ncbi:aldose epimerase family protein [Flavobacteriaceae bacterium 3-367]|uniref:aldose epimerase family protein n=1 Tax=Eudoraea algarum TaxID=3417568 RepID=UPI00327C30F9
MNQITIKNDDIRLEVLDYGAIIQKILVKDKKGTPTNVVVGLEDPMAYLEDDVFLGACVGRYAGRISNQGFVLNNKTYSLYTEQGVHLHGGKEGFGKKYWKVLEEHHGPDPYVKLGYKSPHLEEGYPGNLNATVTYKLVGPALHIIHVAQTDEPTVVNLTNHSYFHLDTSDQLGHHRLRLNLSHRLEIQDNMIPTGQRLPVAHSDYDFMSEKNITQGCLDMPFIIRDLGREVARIYSTLSGILMKVTTNQPAMVVYTPPHFAAICFEAQNYPDAPNQPLFPSSILNPGETYYNHTVFEFGFVN